MTQEAFFSRYIYNPQTDKLGGGSFGKVYKAYDTVLDKFVALKVAEQLEVDGKKFILADEFKALADLKDNKNIAKYEQLFTFSSPQGIFDYAIMQYYPDGNLSQLIKNQILTPKQKESVATQLMNGIEFLHQNKVVHRDLKPSNILIHNRILPSEKEYIPKITDFGLSKKTEQQKDNHFTNSFAAGTYAYSSPEQLRGEPLQFNTDWWAYGVIVYEIFTGSTLFGASKNTEGSSALDVKDILEDILKNDISEKLIALPENWKKVVMACLERNPKKRVQSQKDIALLLNNKETIISTSIPDIEDDKTVVLTKTKPIHSSATSSNDAPTRKNQNQNNVQNAIQPTKKKNFFKEYWFIFPILAIFLAISYFSIKFVEQYINRNHTEKEIIGVPFPAKKDSILPKRDNTLHKNDTIHKISPDLLNAHGKKENWKEQFNKNFDEIVNTEKKRTAASNIIVYQQLKETLPASATNEKARIDKKISYYKPLSLLENPDDAIEKKKKEIKALENKLIGTHAFYMESIGKTKMGSITFYRQKNKDNSNYVYVKASQVIHLSEPTLIAKNEEVAAFEGTIVARDISHFSIVVQTYQTKVKGVNDGKQCMSMLFSDFNFEAQGNTVFHGTLKSPCDKSVTENFYIILK